jgi:hypothetical protein
MLELASGEAGMLGKTLYRQSSSSQKDRKNPLCNVRLDQTKRLPSGPATGSRAWQKIALAFNLHGEMEDNIQRPIRHMSHRQVKRKAALRLLTRHASVLELVRAWEKSSHYQDTKRTKTENLHETFCPLLETTSRSLELPQILPVLHWQCECQSCKVRQGKTLWYCGRFRTGLDFCEAGLFFPVLF